MEKVKIGDTVQIRYTGKLEDGTVVLSNMKNDPLQFDVGKGSIIAGLQKAVVGMEPGESKTTLILADEAFGQRRKDLVSTIPREKLNPSLNPEVGEHLEILKDGSDSVEVTVIDVDDAKITVDANHPLAGRDLVFDIEVKAVETA